MKLGKYIGFLLYTLLLILIGAALVLVVRNNGVYPSGEDTYYHIYRGEYVYRSIMSGDFFPKLNRYWYNGVELMRYWPPLCAYLMAILDMICGGDIHRGYLLYIFVTFVASAYSFYYIGCKLQRVKLGIALGIIWYFMPNNLYALFDEGNLPRVLAMVFLPLFIYFIYDFQQTGKVWNLLKISISFFVLCMCHLGYAGMILVSVLLYLLVYMIGVKGQFIRSIKILIAIVLGFLLAGFYVLPSLTGAGSTADFDKGDLFFQNALLSIDPFKRFTSERLFYFGLAAFVIIVIGIIGSHRNSVPGFITALIIFLLTTKTGQLVVKVLPGHDMLWMLRFISIALVFMLISLMYWKTLKRSVLILFLGFLILDIVPSYNYVFGRSTYVAPTDTLDEIGRNSLLDKAKEICTQRIALLDLSTLDAKGAYISAAYKKDNMNAFGVGFEASVTSDNIVMLNRAVEEGYFPYIFDRSLDLGCDTVLIRMDRIKLKHFDMGVLAASADALGYKLVASNSMYRLYKKDVDSEYFGVVTKYRGIGIGKDARSISLAYPNVRETSDPNINHYTLSELSQYEVVYLANFEYDDRELAENFIREVSDSGIKVVILADRIPEDKKQRINTFLGVSTQRIEFDNGYPLLNVRGYGWIDLDLFPKGYAKWNTFYLNGLDDVYGVFEDNDIELAFYGTKYNDNIVFLALNLPYYYSLTRDRYAEKIIAEFLTIGAEELPERQVVPIKLDFAKDKIRVVSDCDNVNTTLAYHDIFTGKGYEFNNLLYVSRGETIINLSGDKSFKGLMLTFVGMVLTGLYMWFNIKYQRKTDESDH